MPSGLRNRTVKIMAYEKNFDWREESGRDVVAHQGNRNERVAQDHAKHPAIYSVTRDPPAVVKLRENHEAAGANKALGDVFVEVLGRGSRCSNGSDLAYRGATRLLVKPANNFFESIVGFHPDTQTFEVASH
jgi:hypothetical protein